MQCSEATEASYAQGVERLPAATFEQSPRTRARNDTCRKAIKLVKKNKGLNRPLEPREALPKRGKKKTQAHSRSSQKVHIGRFQGLTKMTIQKKGFIIFVCIMSAEYKLMRP